MVESSTVAVVVGLGTVFETVNASGLGSIWTLEDNDVVCIE